MKTRQQVMPSAATFSLYFSSLLLIVASKKLSQEGCSANPLLPERPFVIVWNHPTRNCEDSGVQLDFQKWGIIDNDRDRFFGQKIVLLYNLGKWPYYQHQQGPAVNGGLPQLADIDGHLAQIDQDLKNSIWNITFNGLAIIDQEHWRPLYWTNFDSLKIYQQKSLALVKQRFPQYNKTQVLNEAIKEFDTAARKMMEETLIKVTTKRPTGKWGYYLFPRCWDTNCNASTIFNNDRMSWLFEKSTGLYPSIYFKLKEPPASRGLRIKHTLHEAIRVKAKYAPQDAPIMPYSKSQDGPYQMFGKSDLAYAILEPANMGSSGVVLWGSTSDAMAKNECNLLKDYIENTLGPYSLSVTHFFGNCTQQLCNNHGRCVRKDYERTYQHYLQESNRHECLIPEDQLITKKKYDSSKSHIQKITTSRFSFVKHLKNIMLKKKSFQSKGLFKMSINSQENLSFKNKFHREKKSGLRNTMNKNDFDQFDQDSSINNPAFDNGSPNYDFDDYVCKCYPGHSGIHCDSSSTQD